MRPVLALTPGEPAGIGPDLAVMLARQPPDCGLVVIADPELLLERARQLGLRLDVQEYHPGQGLPHTEPDQLCVWPLQLARPARCGQTDPANAHYVLAAVQRACQGCLQGHFAALVTGPVEKAVICAAGVPFTGHTEYLAGLCGVTAPPIMLMCGGGFRVALVTTHLPLAEVPLAITARRLEATLRVLVRELEQRLQIPQARICVLGLNPHAGEHGWLGREEQEIIIPVLERLRAEGMRLQGPVAADTAFMDAGPAAELDAVLAMYHDQALPVLKTLAFAETVNITLGLPILRTSVDHGVALPLAGSGQAHPGSLQAALRWALAHARHWPDVGSGRAA